MTEKFEADSVPAAMKDSSSKSHSQGSEDGLRVLSYLLAGPLLYGGLGWVGDHFLHTSFLLPVGIVVGMALSVFLVIRRFGQVQ